MLPTGNEKADALWEQFAAEPTLENKNELVVHYLYLVRSIVYRLMPTYRDYANFDDLVSAGVIGLIDAIDRYEITGEVRFEYYATMRIRGEIIDYMRKQDWAPSSLRRRIQSITNAYSLLEGQLSRQPTDAEVAKHLGMDERKLRQTMAKMHTFNVLHFEEVLSEDYAREYTVRDPGETPEQRAENADMKRVLAEVIEELPEKERLVVTLYYYEELTLKEIAGILGVSESRVSQIHSKVILKMRAKIKELIGE